MGVTTAYWAEAKGNPLLTGVDQQQHGSTNLAATWKERKCGLALPIRRCLPR